MQGLVRQRAGRTRGHALAAGYARGHPHRVVEIKGDPGRIALAAPADHIVALNVVASPHAAVAQDARVVVDRDHRVGIVDPASLTPRQPRVLAHSVLAHEHQQLVVGGSGLLGVDLGIWLVGHQQLCQRGAVALEAIVRGRHVHPLLARPNASRGVHASADVDDAHATDANRVIAVVMTQDGDLDPEQRGRIEDRRAVLDGDLLAVDLQRDVLGDRSGCGCRSSRHRRQSPSLTPICPDPASDT
jgi:hypothetical protein